MVNAFPLDMVQYKRLFGTTRIPNKERDELVTVNDSRHVIVMRNNHFYEVEVFKQDGKIFFLMHSLPLFSSPPLSPFSGSPININDLYAQLEAILHDHTPSPTHPICLLPSMNRDDWTDARQELISDTQNALHLEKIDSALFVLSLDETTPTEPVDAMRVFLHNYGFNRFVLNE